MIPRFVCFITGGHRFQGAPETFIDKNEIVHFRHTCIKCDKVIEYKIPWINVWRASTKNDEDFERLMNIKRKEE